MSLGMVQPSSRILAVMLLVASSVAVGCGIFTQGAEFGVQPEEGKIAFVSVRDGDRVQARSSRHLRDECRRY